MIYDSVPRGVGYLLDHDKNIGILAISMNLHINIYSNSQNILRHNIPTKNIYVETWCLKVKRTLPNI